jgi:hypothetical protein
MAKIAVAPAETPTATAEEARQIAEETYVWGYPLVLMDVTRKVLTNFEAPTGLPGQAPMNQFSHAKTFPPGSFRDVVRPNFDTLYSVAWLDLGHEPLVLTLPATDRYHLFPMLDGWTDIFAVPGTRMNGGRGGNYVIVGPDWPGHLPKDMTVLRSPTDIVWIIGRIQTNGAGDYEFVHKLQAQIALVPLSKWGTNYAPGKSKIDPALDPKTPPMMTVDGMNGEAYFTALMEAIKRNPPHVHDQVVVARMKRLGLEPGRSVDFTSLSPAVQQALKDAPAGGMKTIRRRAKNLSVPVNGWSIVSGAIGYFGADYALRSAIALFGLGANRPEDALYPTTGVDGDGKPLSGANRYTLRFPKGGTPPVAAFWSLTMYDDKGFPVENALKRYAIGDRDTPKLDDDGALTIYIQHNSPGADRNSNWLPAPSGPFTLCLRCYSPEPSIVSGEWTPPSITRMTR